MRQEISVQDGKVFVSLFGSLYVEEAAVLRQKLLMHIDKGYNHFVVNLSNVDYIDSSGLGVFVAIHKCDVGQRNTVLADRIVAYYNRELSRRVA